MLQWAEHFKFLAGLYREFEVHWWALSVDKLKKIAKLYCLETSVSLVGAEREGMLSLSDVQLCAVPGVSLAGESGMPPRVNSSLPWGSSREVAEANVVTGDRAVPNCWTLL